MGKAQVFIAIFGAYLALQGGVCEAAKMGRPPLVGKAVHRSLDATNYNERQQGIFQKNQRKPDSDYQDPDHGGNRKPERTPYYDYDCARSKSKKKRSKKWKDDLYYREAPGKLLIPRNIFSRSPKPTTPGLPEKPHRADRPHWFCGDKYGEHEKKKKTPEPTVAPVATPTQVPNRAPTPSPSSVSSRIGTETPSGSPSRPPRISQSPTLSKSPTAQPSFVPTLAGTGGSTTSVPTVSPTTIPSSPPSISRTETPSRTPPSLTPPSTTPSLAPTVVPSVVTSLPPSRLSSSSPSAIPPIIPSMAPSARPTQVEAPEPSLPPVPNTPVSTAQPTLPPTSLPTLPPTSMPSPRPPTAGMEVRATPFSCVYGFEGDRPDVRQFRAAELLTLDFLKGFLKEQFNMNPGTTVQYFDGEAVGSAIGPPRVGYEVGLIFTIDSTVIPSQTEVDLFVETSFQLPSVQLLIDMLRQLPDDNPFSNTLSVKYISLADAQNTGAGASPIEGDRAPRNSVSHKHDRVSSGSIVIIVCIITIVIASGGLLAARIIGSEKEILSGPARNPEMKPLEENLMCYEENDDISYSTGGSLYADM